MILALVSTSEAWVLALAAVALFSWALWAKYKRICREDDKRICRLKAKRESEARSAFDFPPRWERPVASTEWSAR